MCNAHSTLALYPLPSTTPVRLAGFIRLSRHLTHAHLIHASSGTQGARARLASARATSPSQLQAASAELSSPPSWRRSCSARSGWVLEASLQVSLRVRSLRVLSTSLTHSDRIARGWATVCDRECCSGIPVCGMPGGRCWCCAARCRHPRGRRRRCSGWRSLGGRPCAGWEVPRLRLRTVRRYSLSGARQVLNDIPNGVSQKMTYQRVLLPLCRGTLICRTYTSPEYAFQAAATRPSVPQQPPSRQIGFLIFWMCSGHRM